MQKLRVAGYKMKHLWLELVKETNFWWFWLKISNSSIFVLIMRWVYITWADNLDNMVSQSLNLCFFSIKKYDYEHNILRLFETLQKIFFSPQVKRSVIIVYEHGICGLPEELPNKLPNDLRLRKIRILGN